MSVSKILKLLPRRSIQAYAALEAIQELTVLRIQATLI